MVSPAPQEGPPGWGILAVTRSFIDRFASCWRNKGASRAKQYFNGMSKTSYCNLYLGNSPLTPHLFCKTLKESEELLWKWILAGTGGKQGTFYVSHCAPVKSQHCLTSLDICFVTYEGIRVLIGCGNFSTQFGCSCGVHQGSCTPQVYTQRLGYYLLQKYLCSETWSDLFMMAKAILDGWLAC